MENPAPISQRRKTISSNLLFNVDGTVRVSAQPEDDQNDPDTTDTTETKNDFDNVQSVQSYGTADSDSSEENQASNIDPFRKTAGGFHLYGRRHSSNPFN